MAANVESYRGLVESLLEGAEPPMKYLLTYKMSQDHLELFLTP